MSNEKSDPLLKFIAVLFVFSCTVATSIFSMIYGWGVQPKSWTVIIGVGLFLNVFLHILSDKILKK